MEWARQRIGGYKYPREVRILASIPLTPIGKIDRSRCAPEPLTTSPPPDY